MNERIQELAYDAEEYADTMVDGGSEFHPEFVKKFAELIVRECMEVCQGQATYDPIVLPYKPSKQFADAIKKHFGVEE